VKCSSLIGSKLSPKDSVANREPIYSSIVEATTPIGCSCKPAMDCIPDGMRRPISRSTSKLVSQ
jgi:hypothetical protein